MLLSIAAILLVGLLLGYLFTRLRLPALIGMLLTGILLGPGVMNLIAPSLQSISVELRQIALVIILMRAGLALDLDDLKRVGRSAILMSFVPACFEILGVTLLAPLLFPITTVEAALLGTVVAAVSPAVIVPKMLFLMERKIGTRQSIPQMIMAAGSVDDIFVIVLFSAFATLAGGGEISALSFANIPVSILTGSLLGFGVGRVAVSYFKAFHMRDSIKLLILLSAAFLFITLEHWLKERIALSGLLAVMVMGATLLRYYPVLAKRLSSKFSKLWVAAEIFLFVLVGATIDLNYAQAAGVAALLLVLGALMFRNVGVMASLFRSPLELRERLFCVVAFMPKATVQAAIGSLPLAMGLACGQTILTVAVLSILIAAPLGAFLIDWLYGPLLGKGDVTTAQGAIPTDELADFANEKLD